MTKVIPETILFSFFYNAGFVIIHDIAYEAFTQVKICIIINNQIISAIPGYLK